MHAFRERNPARARLRATGGPRYLAVLAVWTGLSSLAVAQAPAPGAAAPQPPQGGAAGVLAAPDAASQPFPDGFLAVKLESTADEVRRTIAKTSEAFEIHDVQGCPTAPAQPCLRIVEKAPKGTGASHSKAEYWFNPFNGRLARITVEYRIGYLDIDAHLTRSFGPPTSQSEKPVAESAFLGAGREVTKVWRQGSVEVELVYLLLGKKTSDAHSGHVEFRSVAQVEMMRDLTDKLKELSPKAGTGAAPAAPGPTSPGDPKKKDDAPPKLF